MASATHPPAVQSSAKNDPSRRGRYEIRRVGVLGAGTMGARIAAHVANAGLPVLLLDMVPKDGSRSSLAAAAVEGLKKAKPAALVGPESATLISVGNFEDDVERLRDCDWIIEAVAENLEIKRSLLARVAPHVRADAILTTNTSGLPISTIGAELPPDLRSRWFGTHFFNPPRYMRLVELIPTPETDPEAVKAVEDFAELKLGKTTVRANDTPNFIANRIGVFAMLNTLRVMKQQGLSVEEIDMLTGSAVGWPKTGTFRLADMVGIDVIYDVARNFAAGRGDERSDVRLSPVMDELVKRRWLGDKTKQGFYKKARNTDGSEARLVLNFDTMEYEPARRASLPSLDAAKSNESVATRIKLLLNGDSKDRVTAFYRAILPELWAYSANRLGEVARTPVEIDQAMKAGFNWELGPFEMWDAAGVPETVERMRSGGLAIPEAVERLLAAGGTSWYRNGGSEFFDVDSRTYQPVELKTELAPVAHYKKAHGIFAGNSGISLVDVGDGIGCFEFHSKMNTIGRDIVTLLQKELQGGSAAMANFDAFIVTGDALNFSAGANLMQLLLAIQDQEWDEIDLMVRDFQAMTKAMKFSPRPVVVGPFGLCLGGGVEIALHAARRQAHVELYTGLVEMSVGLIPAGGGCKEMLLRAMRAASRVRSDSLVGSVELQDAIKDVFETIALAKVSTSAAEARSMWFLDQADGITMNRQRLLFDAKMEALKLVREGYSPPTEKEVAAPGSSMYATLKLGVYLMREGEFISDHDVKIAGQVARVLSGGDITTGTMIGEDYLLDLERQGFLSLCGEPKTAERIAYTLKTGKPLRN